MLHADSLLIIKSSQSFDNNIFITFFIFFQLLALVEKRLLTENFLNFQTVAKQATKVI